MKEMKAVYALNAAHCPVKEMPQIEEAACFIRTPCYISCE